MSKSSSSHVGVYVGTAFGAGILVVIIITLIVVFIHNRAHLGITDSSRVCESSVNKDGDQEVVEDADEQPVYEKILNDVDSSFVFKYSVGKADAQKIVEDSDNQSTYDIIGNGRPGHSCHQIASEGKLHAEEHDDSYVCMNGAL
jgi:hypothetical protein